MSGRTVQRLRALVPLGAVTVADRELELTWLAAGDTDTVIVADHNAAPSRVGTVVGLDTRPQFVLADDAHAAWLDADGHRIALVEAVTATYRVRRQH